MVRLAIPPCETRHRNRRFFSTDNYRPGSAREPIAGRAALVSEADPCAIRPAASPAVTGRTGWRNLRSPEAPSGRDDAEVRHAARARARRLRRFRDEPADRVRVG